MGIFNTTCPLPVSEIKAEEIPELPIVGSVTFQTLLFYISLVFTAITIICNLYISVSHLCCYVRPREQRQVIRVIFYPVVVAVASSFSIYSYYAYLFLWPAIGLYEPISLGAIFFLFVEFAAPDPATREEYFSNLQSKAMKKTGRFQLKKAWTDVSGGSLRWYQGKYVGLYLYFITQIIIKIVEEITQATGDYCQYSFSPVFAHFWVIIISSVALPIGVVAIVQFYVRMNEEAHFKARKPTLKILSFKAVLLLNFIQEIVFEILVGNHVLKDTPTTREQDYSIGLQSLLLCAEQSAVSIWFLWSFSVKEYRDIQRETGDKKMNIFRAALNALNASDLFVGSIYAVRLVLAGVGPKGNGNWRTKQSKFEPLKAPSNIRLHGVASYQGGSSSSSSMMEDVEGRNSNISPSYEIGLHPSAAEHREAASYGYDRSASRSPSPNDYERGSYPYQGHRYQDSRESEQMVQIPASVLGRPED